MAPEPSHLVNLRKICLHCNNTEGLQFMYFNNSNPNQPRYKCKGQRGCGQLFTHGGKIRVPRVVRSRQATTSSTAVVAAADRRAGAARRGRSPLNHRTTTSSAAIAAADGRTGAARQGRPPLSHRAIRQSGAREIQESPASCARTYARSSSGAWAGATCGRSEARTLAPGPLARPATAALGLPRIPLFQPQSPFQSSIVSSIEGPAVRGPVPTARTAGSGLVPRNVVDVARRIASRTAATVVAQAGDVTENWTKAVLGVSPYGLAPASDVLEKVWPDWSQRRSESKTPE